MLAAVAARHRVFGRIVDAIVELRRIRGLRPATDQVSERDAHRDARCLVEAVVSSSLPRLGRTIRDGRFRKVCGAVARNGTRVKRRNGDIETATGDTLLRSPDAFAEPRRNSRDFQRVTCLDGSAPVRHERVGIGRQVPTLVGAALGVGSALRQSGVAALVIPRAYPFRAAAASRAASGREMSKYSVKRSLVLRFVTS